MNKKVLCENINLLDISDEQIEAISDKMALSLSLAEMHSIANYFKKLKRPPTDIELEMIAQTWSEHCKHKTLSGAIDYTHIIDGKPVYKTFKNLLNETIFAASKIINKKQCLSIFKDNAGIVEFDKDYALAFKVETHNHPSALEPYGGAATGIGGVIRDVLGAGLGADPVAATDIFCFASPDTDSKKVPAGVHSPRRIIKGVVDGVKNYANTMGIPTINGSVCFDDSFITNPLVFCGCLGIIPKNKIAKKARPGDMIVVVGGLTGRDGIHGATFSSAELDENSTSSVVQIGSPINEKKMSDALLKARDLNLYTSITDCGAGGLSSAVGELSKETGARVDIEKVPLKYAGLKPWEIWVSESQERMVLSVSKKNISSLKKIFKRAGSSFALIGEFTNTGKMEIFYKNQNIASIDMKFLHEGYPRTKRKAVFISRKEIVQAPIKYDSRQIRRSLIKVISDLNICQKDSIVRQYDFEVKGQTFVKPLQSSEIGRTGSGDAGLIFPYTFNIKTKRAAVLSNGINPHYGKINIYKMAASAIEEAARNAVCACADINKIYIVDNFCWHDAASEQGLGMLVRACEACFDTAVSLGLPFISGKDSLHNEYKTGRKKFSIAPTLLISAVGICDDVEKTMTMYFKESGNKIFVLGLTRNEMGASVFSRVNKIPDLQNAKVPEVFAKESRPLMQKINQAAKQGLIKACHDMSDGGLAVCISEMAMSGNIGCFIDIDKVKTAEPMTAAEILFSESNGRFVIEAASKDSEKILDIFKGSAISEVGFIGGKNIVFKSAKEKIEVSEKIDVLYKAWSGSLKI